MFGRSYEARMYRGLSNIWIVQVPKLPFSSSCLTLVQVLIDISDRTSVLFRRSLQELRNICSIKEALPKSCILRESLLGCVYEGTFDGTKVRIRRVKMCPRGDPQRVKKVCTRRHVSPVLRCLRIPQTFHQVAAMSKHLKHPNIVPLLGVTTEPLELISEWMPGGDLLGYIAKHPDADRLSLVRPLFTQCATR